MQHITANTTKNDLDRQSIPGMAESILEGKATPISERLDSVGWDIS